ncbi:MAG TPA: lipase [Pseudonocardiaceae bacterium]|jgi:hypothetical protein|nr:lipase [Pseudonocardiaceae bacterium]
MNSATKVVAGALAATCLLTTALPASAAPAPTPVRGQLVSEQHLSTLTPAQTTSTLTQAGFDASAVHFGVDAYRLVYRTIDPAGHPTTASGLLVLPRNGSRDLWTMSFTHGTESYRPDAPSSWQPDGFLTSPAVTYASAGFAAVAPDYLGLGAGPGTHPWMDLPSETTASVDMLRAARIAVARTGRTLDRQVLVTGFSQGASAALGLARALRGDPWFRVGAVAPISGAYAFRKVELPAILAGGGQIPAQIGTIYAAYLLVSWNRLHHLYNSPAEVFKAPYDTEVDALFDGSTPGQDMVAALPGTLDALLTPRGQAMLAHPTGAFAAALGVADSVCSDWSPQAPIRLYRADGDEQAADANTTACQAEFAAHGVATPIVDLGTPDYQDSRHLGSAVAGTASIVAWFSQLRAAR